MFLYFKSAQTKVALEAASGGSERGSDDENGEEDEEQLLRVHMEDGLLVELQRHDPKGEARQVFVFKSFQRRFLNLSK